MRLQRILKGTDAATARWQHMGNDDKVGRNKSLCWNEILLSILEIQFLDLGIHRFHLPWPVGAAPEFAHEKDRRFSIFLYLAQSRGDLPASFEVQSFASFALQTHFN
jgi:hypothetical protein